MAMTNRFSRKDIYHKIATEIPIFLYCPMMFPWVMSQLLNIGSCEDIAKSMTRTTLRGHFRTMIKFICRPTILSTSAEAAVDGMIITGVEEEDLGSFEGYPDMQNHQRETVEAEVELTDGEKMTVGTYTYIWNGPLNLIEPQHWAPLDYLKGAYSSGI